MVIKMRDTNYGCGLNKTMKYAKGFVALTLAHHSLVF